MRAEALQQAIYGRLNHSSITNLLSSAYGSAAIFTSVPQQADSGSDAFFPFVSFGPDTITAFNTKTENGGTAVVQIDAWTRSQSFLTVKQLSDAIDARLRHQGLTISGTTHIDTDLDSVSFSLDPDGKTQRAVMLFRVLYLD